MNNIQAKMVCEEVAKNLHAGERVTLRAVYGDSPENKTFSQYTPSAQLTMQVNNPAAFGFFVPGNNYFINFSPAA